MSDRSNDLAMYLIEKYSLGMSGGKGRAQVGHAVMGVVETYWRLIHDEPENDFESHCLDNWNNYEDWRKHCTKIVLKASYEQWEHLKKLPCYIVIDSGYTEIAPGSETILGFWPMRKNEAPDIIKGLQTL